MKCNQSRPGFELVSPCPYPTTITITPRAPPMFLFNSHQSYDSTCIHFIYIWSSCLEMTGVGCHIFARASVYSPTSAQRIIEVKDLQTSRPHQTKWLNNWYNQLSIKQLISLITTQIILHLEDIKERYRRRFTSKHQSLRHIHQWKIPENEHFQCQVDYFQRK